MKRSPLGAIFFTVFLDLLGFGLVLPLLPGFARDYVAPGQNAGLLVGLLMGTYSFMQFLFAPVWGRLSDRAGRRPVLLVSITGSVLSYLLFAFAGRTPWPLAVLFVSRALAGVMAANLATAQAYVADVTTPEERVRGMGMVGAAFGLGFVFGPAIAVGVGHRGELGVGLVAAALSFLCLLYTAACLPESLTPELREQARRERAGRLVQMRRALASPVVGLPVTIFFLSTLVWSGLVEGMLALYLKEAFGYGPSRTGMVFLFLGLTVALVQGGLVRRMARKAAEARMVTMGTLLVGAALCAAPSVRELGLWLGLLLMSLVGLGQGMNIPALTSLISRGSGAEQQGTVLGVTQGFSSLARAMGPALGGWLFGMEIHAPFWAGAALMGAAFLLALRVAGAARAPAGA